MRLSTPYRVGLLCMLDVSLAMVVALAIPSSSPDRCLMMARKLTDVSEKISLLRRFLREFPADPRSRTARSQLISLLSSSNRTEEALQIYRQELAMRRPTDEPDLKYLDLLLKSGRPMEVLKETSRAPNNGHDLFFDEQLFERRVQALLALGRYRTARQAVEQWLGMHEQEGLDSHRFSDDVMNLQYLCRYLKVLERMQGPIGKPIFTAAIPDSLIHWSRKQDVPIVFFQLFPVEAENMSHDSSVADRDQQMKIFRQLVEDMNRGFGYISGRNFSLKFESVHTLYVGTGLLSASGSHTSLLTSRVYVHTIPPLYRLAGGTFVVLVDYRKQPEAETAYMGDGLIHISGGKLHTLPLMHEILHGLGATHQDWNMLVRQGFKFDPGDRGLMTFDQGELRDLGLEEKNRILLDWPPVAAIHVPGETVNLSSLALTPA